MSEWLSVVALFWVLYLADGVSGGRRERLFLSAWRSPFKLRFRARRSEKGASSGRCLAQPARTATLTQAGWFLTPPLPWAWTLALEDLPAGFAPDGLTNWPVASTARPPSLPDDTNSASWDQPGEIGAEGSWITLDGHRFTPITASLNAKELRNLSARLGPIAQRHRAEEISAWQKRFLSVLRARRRLAIGLARTRGLAWLNTLQFTGWLSLSAGLLNGAFNPGQPFGPLGSWRRLDSGQIQWWGLCAALLTAHFIAVLTAWRIHRRLYPKSRDERTNLVLSALLLPAQALRFRLVLLRPLAQGMAPLAGALAAGTPRTARAAAAATLRDIRHPIRPSGLPAAIANLADEAAQLARPVVEQALSNAAIDGAMELLPFALLAPPANTPPEVCAYCPRCGDGFVRMDGKCPHGVGLLPIHNSARQLI
jgi:hypothetical protein